MRVAVIGAGAIGRVHARALRQIAGAELAGLGVRAPSEASQQLARELGTELARPEELLARRDIDAVVIATPTDTHLALVQAAAHAGKQIICEKPLARSLADAEALIAVARRAGVKLAIGLVVRYFPAYAAAHAALLRGELGAPVRLHASRGGSFPVVAGDWYADSARSGGVALDLMIHDFDWARWLFGPVEQVSARRASPPGAARAEHVVAELRFRSGAAATIEGSWGFVDGFRSTFELAGSAGQLRYDSRPDAALPGAPADAGVAVPAGAGPDDPYLLQMRDCIGWLGGGPPPRCDASDALAALRISLAVLESIGAGRPIEIEFER